MQDRNEPRPMSEAEKEALWKEERAAIIEYKDFLSRRLGKDAGWFLTYWEWNNGPRDEWLKSKGYLT